MSIVFGTPEADRIAAGARPRQCVAADGLIEFDWWPNAPSIYATETQLKQAGLKPGGPAVARVSYGRGRTARSYLLYDGRAAVPRKEATPAQQAALEKAQLARRTCVECGTVKERPGELDAQRVCWPCVYWAEEYEHLQDRDAAIGWARYTLQQGTALILDDEERSPVILDTETTSLGGYICEIAIIDLAGNVVFDSLINPLVPNEATHIHGITDAMTKHVSTFADVASVLRQLLQERTVIVYNADYDRAVLWSEWERWYEATVAPNPTRVPPAGSWGTPAYAAWEAAFARWKLERDTALAWFATSDWQCAMENYSAFVNEWSEYHEDYRWQPLGGGHRALGDCRACLDVIEHMAASPTMIEQRLRPRGARVYAAPAQ